MGGNLASMNIIIIGGHGKVALRSIPLIVQAGHEVTAVIRDPAQASDIELAGAAPVVEDIQSLDAEGWDRLLAGRDAVIWAAGAGGGAPERTWAIDRDAAIASMDAAQRTGALRYLMVSFFGAADHGVPEDDDFYPYAQAKKEADEHLEASALDWTILQPSTLTLDEGSGRISVDDKEASHVSRANVAAVLAATIERPELAGRVIEFNDGEVPIDEALDRLTVL